jgi:tRNA U34 2-thiouridine synthase MnmA/TrmU
VASIRCSPHARGHGPSVHVEGINFYIGFCVEGHTHAIRKHHRSRPKRNNALWVAELGIRLHIIDEYKQIVINPKHGYGANLNPCLDCKIFMVRKAHEWMNEHGFDFIVTGEINDASICRWSRVNPVRTTAWCARCVQGI